MPIGDRNLQPGQTLVAKYKGEEHRAAVIANPDGEGTRIQMGDATYKSVSSAGNAVMGGGKAVNGWLFWSVEGAAKVGRDDAVIHTRGRRGGNDGATEAAAATTDAPAAPGATVVADRADGDEGEAGEGDGEEEEEEGEPSQALFYIVPSTEGCPEGFILWGCRECDKVGDGGFCLPEGQDAEVCLHEHKGEAATESSETPGEKEEDILDLFTEKVAT